MALDPLYESHIGRVAVAITLFGVPDATRLSAEFGVAGEVDGNDWTLRSVPDVQSKDINDHLGFVLTRLIPHAERIRRLTENGSVYVDVLWESTYLYAGTGPIVTPDSIQGLAQLEAELGFDIYQLGSGDAA